MAECTQQAAFCEWAEAAEPDLFGKAVEVQDIGSLRSETNFVLWFWLGRQQRLG